MTRFTIFSAAAILSTTITTAALAQAAVQEPGLNAFYESLGVVGSGPGPMPWPLPRSSYDSMDHNAPNEPGESCAQRYRSYDPSSGTFRGYDGRRHQCG
jgi:BA14K-like protein